MLKIFVLISHIDLSSSDRGRFRLASDCNNVMQWPYIHSDLFLTKNFCWSSSIYYSKYIYFTTEKVVNALLLYQHMEFLS